MPTFAWTAGRRRQALSGTRKMMGRSHITRGLLCAQNGGSHISRRAGHRHRFDLSRIGEPRAEGSTGFVGKDVQTVIDTVATPGFEDAIRASDKNGDSRLCIKIIPKTGGPPQFDLAFVYIDNKI